MRLVSRLEGDALWAALDALAARTGKSVEGYAHVYEVLAHLERTADGQHISPAVLIDGFRDYTRAALRGQALVMLDLWGIGSTTDLGSLALDLVDAKLVLAHASDRRRDFAAGFDFEAAFPLDEPEEGLPGGGLLRAVDGVADRLGRRYDVHGFLFIYEALGRAKELFPGRAQLHATELLEGLRALALERFGAEARARLLDWGVRSTEDVGEMVFALVDRGLMSTQPSDRRSDFDGVYDFTEAFPA